MPCQDPGSSARNAAPTTTAGSTKGTVSRVEQRPAARGTPRGATRTPPATRRGGSAPCSHGLTDGESHDVEVSRP